MILKFIDFIDFSLLLIAVGQCPRKIPACNILNDIKQYEDDNPTNI